jgi:hypothetical protein
MFTFYIFSVHIHTANVVVIIVITVTNRSIMFFLHHHYFPDTITNDDNFSSQENAPFEEESEVKHRKVRKRVGTIFINIFGFL